LERIPVAPLICTTNSEQNSEGSTNTAGTTAEKNITVEKVTKEATINDNNFVVEQANIAFEANTFEIGLKATTTTHDNDDPTTYKDKFLAPNRCQESWHHKDPFQREKWRHAI
jgi:hypothetical protein